MIGLVVLRIARRASQLAPRDWGLRPRLASSTPSSRQAMQREDIRGAFRAGGPPDSVVAARRGPVSGRKFLSRSHPSLALHVLDTHVFTGGPVPASATRRRDDDR